ncbi:hypothetical protein Fcan01_25039 [Folsomia candida]|uniref:Fungal lipase-like domain-containing protein n=1 Tax=Folsomia candida TaxID=158441 RepID=A0A226D7L5_FOLCA|nr:hypothetical protein Fcan01_25039 [Folsomia candida]
MEVKFERDENLAIYPPNWDTILDQFLHPPDPTFSTKDLELSKKLQLEPYPSIGELSILAKIAYSSYEDAKEELKLNLSEYEIICHAENESFHASIFFREGSLSELRHRQLMIAFRGTEFEKGDVEADLQGIVNNQKTPQINSACTFALNFREIVEKIVTLSIDTDPVHLILTGHSLGGWLAQIATFALKYVEFSHCATQFKRVKDDRCHAHCVVFDSPGAQLILNYINSLPEIRKNHDLHTISLDICNYVIYPNLVNVINPPFGDMVQISSEQICASLKPLKSLAFSTIGHTRRFHSIDVFIQILNPGNQFPRSVTSLLKQPSELFCDEMLARFSNVKFSGTDPLEIYGANKNPLTILISASKDILTLTLLKFIFLKRNGSNLSLNTAIILKYDPKNSIYRGELDIKLNAITLIIIYCIEGKVSDDQITKFSFNPSIKYVWLKHCTDIKQTFMPNSDEPAQNENKSAIPRSFVLHDFDIDDELLSCIMTKKITLQGQQHLLRDVIPEKIQELKEFLDSSPSSILSILEGSQEMGHTPKTVFDLKSTYFDIARTMNRDELLAYYSRKVAKYETIVVFECNKEDYLIQQRVIEPLSQAQIRIFILPRAVIDSVVEFQNSCSNEKDSLVDLIRCSDDANISQPFTQLLQYVPNFYAIRKINKPGFDLEAECNYSKFEMHIECYVGHDFKVEMDENDRLNMTISSYESLYSNLYQCKSLRFIPHENGYVALSDYSDADELFFPNVEIPEDELSFEENRFIILSDEPGMGKSTTVVKLANKILQQNIGTSHIHFLILIELKTLQNIGCIELNGDNFISSFVHCISANQKFNEFSKFLLRNIISGGNAVTIIADGFDEMTQENKELWKNVLLQIRLRTKIRIIITTRPHDANMLQSTLCVLAHTFVPLEEDESIEKNDKIQFLVNLWSPAIRCRNEDNLYSDLTLLTEFATQVIFQAHTHLVKGRERFLGVPLQLRILSEIFLPNVTEYVASAGERGGIEDLKGKISLSYIYQKFIDRKYNIYLLHKNFLSNASIIDRHVSRNLDERMYKIAGEVINFGENYDSLIIRACGNKLLCPDQSDIDDIIRVGLVYEDKEAHNLQFIHRTFAEFYVAKFLADVINRLSSHANNSFEEDSRLVTDIFLKHSDKIYEVMPFMFLSDMLKARLAEGLSYTNFPKFKDNERRLDYLQFLVFDARASDPRKLGGVSFSYLIDFLVSTVTLSDLHVKPILKIVNFRVSLLYTHGLEPFVSIFSVLRRMLETEGEFRDIKWLFHYDASSEDITSIDITSKDLSNEFNPKNYVRGISFSPDSMELPYWDKVYIPIRKSWCNANGSIDESLIEDITRDDHRSLAARAVFMGKATRSSASVTSGLPHLCEI